jgi:hypothetical protein
MCRLKREYYFFDKDTIYFSMKFMKSLYLNIFGKHSRILRLKYLHKNFVLLKIIVVRIKNLRKNYYEKYKKKKY